MSRDFAIWSIHDLERYKVSHKFLSWDDFFGRGNRPRPQYDKHILDDYIIDHLDSCSVETINLHNHLYNRDRDDDTLTDYAFALLWFTGFIVTPRHTTRRVVSYSFYGAANYIKHILNLHSGGRTILFVAHAQSIDEGLPKIMAGVMGLSAQDYEGPVPRSMYPAILLINRVVVFIKINLDMRTATLIGNDKVPERRTLIECYSTMDITKNQAKVYESRHLPNLLQAMEAFKKFVKD